MWLESKPAGPLFSDCLSPWIFNFKKLYVIHCLVVLLLIDSCNFQLVKCFSNELDSWAVLEFWIMFKTSRNENMMSMINKHNIQRDIRYAPRQIPLSSKLSWPPPPLPLPLYNYMAVATPILRGGQQAFIFIQKVLIANILVDLDY